MLGWVAGYVGETCGLGRRHAQTGAGSGFPAFELVPRVIWEKCFALFESLILKSQRKTVVFRIPDDSEASEYDLWVIKLHSNSCRWKAILAECHENHEYSLDPSS